MHRSFTPRLGSWRAVPIIAQNALRKASQSFQSLQDNFDVDAISDVAEAMKLPVSGVDIDEVGDTDSASFLKIGIPAIRIHSLTQETIPILHTRRDKLEALHLDWDYETFRLMAPYLAYLDQGLE